MTKKSLEKIPSNKRTLVISGVQIEPGQRMTLDLPIALLYTHSQVAIPVHVIRGRKQGPCLFVCAAIHGDEIIGVEIIRRLLKQSSVKRLRGDLIVVPVVNVHGFIHHSRYLPDRRDLNRCFPGSETGSLAARLAHIFLTEIVSQSTHGIDLHSGALHRSNLPQIRANTDDEETLDLAKAFGVPVLLNTQLRDGSLRSSAVDMGVPTLLYEAGEALRFNEVAVRTGVRGILNVMRSLDMISSKGRGKTQEVFIAKTSTWIRSPTSGIFKSLVKIGDSVKKDSLIGSISEPLGESESQVYSPYEGVIIGMVKLPLVNEGDALLHIARYKNAEEIATQVEELHTATLEATLDTTLETTIDISPIDT